MEIIIKMDHDEPVKTQLSSLYGECHPLPDYDPEILRSEIQDLKLENDRLKQRNAVMLRFIKSLCCSGETCSRDCDLYFEWYDHDCCALLHPKELDQVASDIIKKLEEL